MADTVTIDIRDMSVGPASTINIAVVNQPNPVAGYSATEYELSRLINIPKYRITDSATGEVISGVNWSEYFPSGGGGGGTTNYNQLDNKPSINNVTLDGNKTTSDLGINLGDLASKNSASGTYTPTMTTSVSGKTLTVSFSEDTITVT